MSPGEAKWKLVIHTEAQKELRKLDRPVAARILKKLRSLSEQEHPEASCKALTGGLSGLWRVLAGDWRVIVDIQPNRLVILAVGVGHRSKVYD